MNDAKYIGMDVHTATISAAAARVNDLEADAHGI